MIYTDGKRVQRINNPYILRDVVDDRLLLHRGHHGVLGEARRVQHRVQHLKVPLYTEFRAIRSMGILRDVVDDRLLLHRGHHGVLGEARRVQHRVQHLKLPPYTEFREIWTMGTLISEL